MSYVSHIDAWTGKAVAIPFNQWLEQHFTDLKQTPYRFKKAACTEPFVGMIHSLAAIAADFNMWPYSLIPTAEEVEAKECLAAAWNPPYAMNGDNLCTKH